MTTAFIPGDEDARLRIRESLDETLFVEAGAGTGKTTSLVDRVYGLVLSGRTTLDNIAAITFTEAAAAELRDKIRERFEQGADDTLLRHEQRSRAEQGVAESAVQISRLNTEQDRVAQADDQAAQQASVREQQQQRPDPSLETEAVNLVVNEYLAKANTKVIKTADEMIGTLIDTKV